MDFNEHEAAIQSEKDTNEDVRARRLASVMQLKKYAYLSSKSCCKCRWAFLCEQWGERPAHTASSSASTSAGASASPGASTTHDVEFAAECSMEDRGEDRLLLLDDEE